MSFAPPVPAIAAISPPLGSTVMTTPVTGSAFLPGLNVSFGSIVETATNVTGTSFDVLVTPQPISTVTVVVTNPNGQFDTRSFGFDDSPDHGLTLNSVSITSFDVFHASEIAASGGLQYVSGQLPFPAPSSLPSTVDVGVSHDPAGRLAAVSCAANGGGCGVVLAVDTDDDLVDDEVPTIFDSLPSGTVFQIPSLLYDPSGAPAISYMRRTNQVGREWVVASSS